MVCPGLLSASWATGRETSQTWTRRAYIRVLYYSTDLQELTSPDLTTVRDKNGWFVPLGPACCCWPRAQARTYYLPSLPLSPPRVHYCGPVFAGKMAGCSCAAGRISLAPPPWIQISQAGYTVHNSLGEREKSGTYVRGTMPRVGARGGLPSWENWSLLTHWPKCAQLFFCLPSSAAHGERQIQNTRTLPRLPACKHYLM